MDKIIKKLQEIEKRMDVKEWSQDDHDKTMQEIVEIEGKDIQDYFLGLNEKIAKIDIAVEEVKEDVDKEVAENGEPIVKFAPVDESLTVAELKAMAKEMGITGFSRMKEAQLIKEINKLATK